MLVQCSTQMLYSQNLMLYNTASKYVEGDGGMGGRNLGVMGAGKSTGGGRRGVWEVGYPNGANFCNGKKHKEVGTRHTRCLNQAHKVWEGTHVQYTQNESICLR